MHYFIITLALLAPAFTLAEEAANIHSRGDFRNSKITFAAGKNARVAFIGGSITEMNGYRPMICNWLKERFPKTEFDFVNAGISSTCSTTGAFRLSRDVFDKTPVDLLFIEFAVNDDQDAAHSRRDCIRGMEGILRHIRREHPYTDIVVTYFVNPGMLKLLQEGKTPVSIAAHEEVAEHYGVSTVWLAREVAERITADKLDWQTYGGTHPKPAGNKIAADMNIQLLTHAWKKAGDNAERTKHELPQTLIDEASYVRGRFLSVTKAKFNHGWSIHIPDWKSLPGGKRDRFTSLKMLCATTPGAECSVEFEGNAIGAYVSAGPDAGVLEAKIDDGDFKRVDLYHRFSKGLHYPRTVMFAAGLKDGKHTLTLRVAEDSQRTAARIMEFTVN